MPTKLEINDVDFSIKKFEPQCPLLKQYFQLRFEVYHSFNMPFYAKPTSTRWDRHPDTRFLLITDKKTGKVLGGRRFIIHHPHSETGIYSEENTGFSIDEMLPHLYANSMRFAEFGSLCFAPELRGTGISAEMYKHSFAYMREIEVDFIVSNPVSSNYQRLKDAAFANGIKQFITRDDLPSFEDGDDEPTIFMAFKTVKELNLTPPAPAEKFHNGIATNERQLLQKIFNTSFVNCVNCATLNKRFFTKKLTLKDLHIAHKFLHSRSANIDGIDIKGAHRINCKKPNDEKAFMLLVQLHGNEPAGLAAFLYALALRQANLITKPIIAVIGNRIAAKQYFADYASHPNAPQHTRDVFRRGLDLDGKPLADMNRLPANFRELDPATAPYIKRWHELDFIANNVTGILDIHSARGNMVCITDISNQEQLKFSNIRDILVGLTDAIGSNTASQTFKTIVTQKPNIQNEIGIEASTHEAPKSFRNAAKFASAVYCNLGISSGSPKTKKETGIFEEYQVSNKLSFSDLIASAPILENDSFITVKKIDDKLVPYQYEEMEKIRKGQIVAQSTTSSTTLKAPSSFAGVFFTKSAELFSDPAVGTYPVSANNMDTKFCYPCTVKKIKIEFKA